MGLTKQHIAARFREQPGVPKKQVARITESLFALTEPSMESSR
jgi:hypothetical protein